MAKRKYRIEGGHYGGECVIGEVNNHFVSNTVTLDESQLVDTILEFDDWNPDIDENAEIEISFHFDESDIFN